MKQSVEQVKGEILDAASAVIEYKNALRQIDWDLFDRGQTRLEQLVSESQFLIDLYAKYPLFDKDTGKITEKGIATRGLLVQNYETYINQAKQLQEEIAELKKELEADPSSTTLIDRIKELEQNERDAILASEGLKESLRDLRENELNALIDSISKLIDKFKESLKKQKDLYDYQKSISEQNDNINKLKRQLLAWDNGDDTSQENLARVQKLKDDLKKAETQLKETEWDRYISETEEILDNLLEDLKSWVEEKLEDLNGILREAIESTNLNGEQIRNTIEQTSAETGYIYTEEFTKIWDNLSESFSQNFDIENEVKDVCSEIQSDILELPTENGLESYLSGETYQIVNEIANTNNAVSSVESAVRETNQAVAQIGSRIAEYAAAIKSGIDSAQQAAQQAKQAAQQAQSTANQAKSEASAARSASNRSNNNSNTLPSTKYEGGNQNYYIDVYNTGGMHIKRYDNLTYDKAQSQAEQLRKYYKNVSIKHYAKGGLVTNKNKNPLDFLAEQLGEDHVIATKEGERILTAKQNENFEKLANAFSSLSAEDMAKYSILTGNKMIGKMPTLQMPVLRSMEQGGNTEINGGISINLPNVTNKAEFVEWLKTDGQIEKIVQSMTLGKLQGRNSYDKMKY